MNTREKALFAASPAVTVLVLSLAWYLIDRHILDRGVRLLDRFRI